MSEDLHRRVLSGILWSAVQNWGGRVVSLLLFAILARLLDPHQFGVFATAMVVLGFLTLFVDQGLAEAIVQRPRVTPALLNTAFVVNFALSLMIFVLLWFASPFIAKYMKVEELSTVLKVASLSIPFNALGFSQQAMHKRHFHFRWIAICSFASTILSGVIGTVLAFSGYGIWSLVAQLVSAALVNSVLLWFRAQWRFSFDLDLQGVRGLFSYGMNRLGSHVLYYGYARCIELFLVTNLGAAGLGVYLVGVRIYQSLTVALGGAILEVAHSGFSRVASGGGSVIGAYYKAITVTSAIAVPVFVLLACVAPEATVVCFGAKWAQSAEVMRPMALLGAVEMIESYNGTVFNAIGKPQIGFLYLLFKTPAVLLVLWFARDLPLASIVWWYVGGQLLTMVPSFVLTSRLVGISLKEAFSRVRPFVLGCAIASMPIVALHWNGQFANWQPIYRLIVLSAVGVLTYVGFVSLTARNVLFQFITTIRRGHRGPSR